MAGAFVYWRSLDGNDFDNEAWDQLRCLYAYFSPHRGELLYLGKAWGKTVFERWKREAKNAFWNDLERERRIFEHSIRVGTIALHSGDRLTHALVKDIESLLIITLRPWGNIQNSKSRGISRPGLAVVCRGDWPLRTRTFRDTVL